MFVRIVDVIDFFFLMKFKQAGFRTWTQEAKFPCNYINHYTAYTSW